MSFETRPLSFALGTEILSVDLSQPVSDTVFRAIHRAFLDSNGLLLFRNQVISREEHIAFTRRFGDLDLHDSVPLDRHPQFPEVLVVSNEPVVEGMKSNGGRYIGAQWHSDLAPSLAPALGSLLRAVTIPAVGGDTMFANMYAAYDSLSDGMKALIAN